MATAAHKIRRANVLLAVDEADAGPSLTDEQVTRALGTTRRPRRRRWNRRCYKITADVFSTAAALLGASSCYFGSLSIRSAARRTALESRNSMSSGSKSDRVKATPNAPPASSIDLQKPPEAALHHVVHGRSPAALGAAHLRQAGEVVAAFRAGARRVRRALPRGCRPFRLSISMPRPSPPARSTRRSTAR